MNGRDVFEWKQQVVPCGKQLQPGSNPGISVRKRLERLTVDDAGPLGQRDFVGIFAASEQILPLTLGEQGAAIHQHANFTVGPGLRQNFKLLVGSSVFACKAQEFKQKRATASFGRMVSDFGAQSFDGIRQSARSI